METKPNKAERKRETVAALARLAELFPACFTVGVSGPHRPLKVGIRRDLIERGVQPREAKALWLYARRVAYLAALAAGGPRYDLDGNPSGEVTAEQMADALAKVQVATKTAQDRKEAERIEREKTRAREGGKAFEAIRTAGIQREAKAVGRLSLADLKRAAQARKAAQQAA